MSDAFPAGDENGVPVYRPVKGQDHVKRPAYPNYKESGSPWLGKVPAHWKSAPLKYLARIQAGYAFSSYDFAAEGIPVLRIGNITKEGRVDFSNAKYLPEEYGARFRKVIVQQGDIVMAMSGSTIGKAGRYHFDTPALLN